MADDTYWDRTDSTAAKHRLYERYLKGWWPKLLQSRWDRITYIEGFAGPGRYRQGEPGSPILALGQVLNLYRAPKFGLSRDRVHLIFIEERADRYAALCSEITSKFGPLDQLPVTVRIIHGSAAEEIIPSLAGRWGGPILAVFDSWGNVSVPLEVTRRIASNRSSEVLITFGPNYFSRQSTLRSDEATLVFGGTEWQRAHAATGKVRLQAFLDIFKTAMRSAGFPYTLDFRIVSHTGHALDLVFGTQEDAGLDVMKAAMWEVDPGRGEAFVDLHAKEYRPSPDQPMLINPGGLECDGDAPDPQLLGYVLSYLDRIDQVSVDLLRTRLLRETARWRELHAPIAVRYLRDQDLVTTEPNQVVRSTNVWLTSSGLDARRSLD